jgi:hypothetical protein
MNGRTLHAHNHSLRSQKRHLVTAFQSNTPFRASSAASLGVGLGVREGSGFNAFFPVMVVEELVKEYCDEELFGGYM